MATNWVRVGVCWIKEKRLNCRMEEEDDKKLLPGERFIVVSNKWKAKENQPDYHVLKPIEVEGEPPRQNEPKDNRPEPPPPDDDIPF